MPVVQRIDKEDASLLVIDVQERLLPHIHNADGVLAQTARMLRAAKELGLSVTVSEQYPKGLGPTDPGILDAAGDSPRIEKLSFSFCGCKPGRERVTSLNRSQILLVGIETHVCVQQTALDLREMGLLPIVLADAVSSRRPSDHEVALARLRDAGALITTVESAIYEMVVESGTELFKRLLPIVR